MDRISGPSRFEVMIVEWLSVALDDQLIKVIGLVGAQRVQRQVVDDQELDAV